MIDRIYDAYWIPVTMVTTTTTMETITTATTRTTLPMGESGGEVWLVSLKVGQTTVARGKIIEVTSIGQSNVAVKIGVETKFMPAGSTQTIGGMKVTVPPGGISIPMKQN